MVRAFECSVGVFAAGVDFCQSAFAGFPETVIQIDTGFVHGTADHIIADVPGAGEEVA